MKTPIRDFIREYSESDCIRAHMPGHKGKGLLGFESQDITEICGADSLYEANGIIAESEKNAGALFGTHTFYSTEGSSLCNRAMLYLCALLSKDKKPRIFASRNAHSSFASAAALLNFEVEWLFPKKGDSYISCNITAESLEERLEFAIHKPVAVFVTSPDYLGNMLDIRALSQVCHRYGVLLIVDNAHGAYLKFLPESRHPIDLGADMCCDSAHKTLPVLTGGAYLHISPSANELLLSHAKAAMALFGSSSPSYLILESLDVNNEYLASGYRERLADFVALVRDLKTKLMEFGYKLLGDEPLKITIDTADFGYNGGEFARILTEKGIIPEYADRNFIVLMLTEQLKNADLSRIEKVLTSIQKREAINIKSPVVTEPKVVMSLGAAAKQPFKLVPTDEAVGKVAAFGVAVCPPAVDIVAGGELISEAVADVLKYYGKDTVAVIE